MKLLKAENERLKLKDKVLDFKEQELLFERESREEKQEKYRYIITLLDKLSPLEAESIGTIEAIGQVVNSLLDQTDAHCSPPPSNRSPGVFSASRDVENHLAGNFRSCDRFVHPVNKKGDRTKERRIEQDVFFSEQGMSSAIRNKYTNSSQEHLEINSGMKKKHRHIMGMHLRKQKNVELETPHNRVSSGRCQTNNNGEGVYNNGELSRNSTSVVCQEMVTARSCHNDTPRTARSNIRKSAYSYSIPQSHAQQLPTYNGHYSRKDVTSACKKSCEWNNEERYKKAIEGLPLSLIQQNLETSRSVHRSCYLENNRNNDSRHRNETSSKNGYDEECDDAARCRYEIRHRNIPATYR